MTKINHADRDHAKLSPSSSGRWINCPGSERVIPIFKKENPHKHDGSRHSRVGTMAHEVMESYLLNKKPDRAAIVSANQDNDDEMLTDDEWEEILGHGLEMREYVRGLMDEDDILLVEKRVHMDQISDGIFGTADVIIYKRKEKKLILVDLKYGMMKVDPIGNTQILLYLVGADNLMTEMGYEVTSYEGHIYQPRIYDGIGFDSYDVEHIEAFIDVAQSAVDIINDNDDRRIPGEKQCQWCPVFGTKYCPESVLWMSRDALRLIDELDNIKELTMDDVKNKTPEELTNEDMAQMYLLFPMVNKWMKLVEERLITMTEAGNVDSLKIVEGRGSNKCIDPDEVEFIVGDAAWKPPVMKSVTDLKRIVGAKNFDNLLGDCFRKMPGKPKLVAADDKREAIKKDADLLKEMDDLSDN